MFALNNLMASPALYDIVQAILGYHLIHKEIADNYISGMDGNASVLDLGAGTGIILDYLPKCNYYAVDMSSAYLKKAKNRPFQGRVEIFKAEAVSFLREKNNLLFTDGFDVVLALGFLHHLSDVEALSLLSDIKVRLKSGGKLITMDPVRLDNQSWFAKFMINIDRGDYIRHEIDHFALLEKVFTNVRGNVYRKIMRVPSNCIICELSN